MVQPAIYLAAAFNRKEEMRAHRYVLQEMGYKVTSNWIDQIGLDTFGPSGSIEDLHTASDRAIQDLSDILRSDMFFMFTDTPSTTGGRHTELGIAIALNKLITVIGPRENVFQALATHAWYPSWEEALRAIREMNGIATDEARSASSATPADIPTV